MFKCGSQPPLCTAPCGLCTTLLLFQAEFKIAMESLAVNLADDEFDAVFRLKPTLSNNREVQVQVSAAVTDVGVCNSN